MNVAPLTSEGPLVLVRKMGFDSPVTGSDSKAVKRILRKNKAYNEKDVEKIMKPRSYVVRGYILVHGTFLHVHSQRCTEPDPFSLCILPELCQ